MLQVKRAELAIQADVFAQAKEQSQQQFETAQVMNTCIDKPPCKIHTMCIHTCA
jgi:hypothetical protein